MAEEPIEWQIESACASPGKFKKFSKKHRQEYDSMFANLEKIMNLLRNGHKIGGFSVGFFRSEGEGVYRIGQTGVPSAKESRLYVFPDEQNRVMHVLNIGDKDSQHDDVNEAKQAAKNIKSTLSQ
ncbi:MAG: hypothetical protein KGJ88_00040 [Verrucomicrobiota bacterium]|nr:hypothetical protein [Verrucomicrobiota bacterium]